MESTPIANLYASAPEGLSFAPSLHIRAFLLRRPAGDLLVYNAPALADEALDGVARQYLNHWHEAAFGGDGAAVPLAVHTDDRAQVERHRPVDAAFGERATLDGDFELIPTPGHTPGATAFLWDSGEHRVLFTGDSVYLRDGEWVAAMLEGSSDREAYIRSLELLRELDFDVLLPWAASADRPYHALTDAADARSRLDAIVVRLRAGEDH